MEGVWCLHARFLQVHHLQPSHQPNGAHSTNPILCFPGAPWQESGNSYLGFPSGSSDSTVGATLVPDPMLSVDGYCPGYKYTKGT